VLSVGSERDVARSSSTLSEPLEEGHLHPRERETTIRHLRTMEVVRTPVGSADETVPTSLVEVIHHTVRSSRLIEPEDGASLWSLSVMRPIDFIVDVNLFSNDRWRTSEELPPLEGTDVEEELDAFDALHEPVESGWYVLDDSHSLANELGHSAKSERDTLRAELQGPL
jgi:hypothetical protein